MELKETLSAAIYSLRSHKTRSALTMLGIIIGIAAVILITSIGNGQIQILRDALGQSGINSLGIKINTEYTGELPITPKDWFSTSDVKKISELPFIKYAASIQQIASPYIKILNKNNNLEINKKNWLDFYGATKDHFKVSGIKLICGRFFKKNENKPFSIIGHVIAQKMFGSSKNALGKHLSISVNRPDQYHGIYHYTIIGVIQNPYADFTKIFKDLPGGMLEMYIPMLQFQKITGKNRAYAVNCKYQSGLSNEKAKSLILSNIAKIKGNPKQKYTFVDTLTKFINKSKDSMKDSNFFVSLIAAVSLLVGGIGLMAIMLVTVKERTREIGVRKALGATDSNIIFQFLTESLIISLIGGIIGIIVGIISSIIAGLVTEIPPVPRIDMIIGAFVVSVIIGVVFGIYPAAQAAKMEPVEALRHE